MNSSDQNRESNERGIEEQEAPAVQGSDETAPLRPMIVGIGASAGGLKALRAFFEALPDGEGMIFVVIVHLAPERESIFADLLQPYTDLPVMQVTERVRMEAGHVYVIPPGKRLTVVDGHLELSDFQEPRGQRAPIDLFFRTLAQEYGDGIAIILSGTGTDGSIGIRDMKEWGSLLMVQDPEEAEFDGMPRSAIATGMVDIVLPVQELAKEVIANQQYKRDVKFPTEPEVLPSSDRETLQQILAYLRLRMGHDFSQYKHSTVLRRITRRMQVNHISELAHYLRLLRQKGNEAEMLFRDLLISVTSFFRDAEAFRTLEEQVIPRLFAKKEPSETVRVWVAGCATGEEAYSLLMLLLEYRNRLEQGPNIQVFATDLDDRALEFARHAVYPEAIAADLSDERLERFFSKENDHYRIKAEVRDRVFFSLHNLLKDPPFSKMDLISCRNLLIYLDRSVQDKVLEVFYYGLRPEGYLFLGNAESAEGAPDLFCTLDKKSRIYQCRNRDGAQLFLPSLPMMATNKRQTRTAVEMKPRKQSETQLHLQMLEEFSPPSVLVNQEYRVVNLSEKAGRYLLAPAGPWTSDLLRLVRPEMENEVRSAIYQAFEHSRTTVSRPVWVDIEGTQRLVYILVRLQPPSEEQERLALLFFIEDELSTRQEQPEGGDVAGDQVLVQQLEEELHYHRQRLQVIREEHEVYEEELTAANEELQSINEEYKSTLEELETSKEELQSMNEELQTVNQELRSKIDEVSLAHGDLLNLLAATDIATLFLDRSLCITRYTPRAAELFHLMPSDRGRPIAHLRAAMDYPMLENDAQTVLQDLAPVEREIRGEDGRWYLARLRAYRTIEDRINGLVLVFIDITGRKAMEEQVRSAQEYSERIVDTVRQPLVVLDPHLRVRSANAAFYASFHVAPAEAVGRNLFELGNGQWNIPELRALLEDVLPENHVFTDFMVEQNFERIGRRIMLLNGSRLDNVQLILLSIEDITERQQALEELKALNLRLEERSVQVRVLATELSLAEQRERHRVAQILHDDLQQLLYALQFQFQIQLFHRMNSQQQVETVAQLEELTAAALHTTRTLTVDLSPPILEGEGLVEALEWLANQVQTIHNFHVVLEVQEPVPVIRDELRVLLFRSARELIFNVVKHADVPEARIMLRQQEGQIILTVEDEGAGFDTEALMTNDALPSGLGLRTIRERLALFDGRMEFESAPDHGTRVTIYLPLANAMQKP